MPPTASQPSRGNLRKKNDKTRVNGENGLSQRDNDASQELEYEAEDSDEDVEMDGNHGENATDIQRKANELIRLAISMEYRRLPLKRDDITKRVFGGRTTKNQFDRTMNAAQEGLRNTFGMELCELVSRAEKQRADAAREGANENGEMQIAGMKRKVSTSSSRQYILRSVLGAGLIEATALFDMEIEEAERRECEELYPDQDDRRANGTLIAYGSDEDAYQLSLAGTLHILLALILVNGRTLSDAQLKNYLKRLRLPVGAQPPTTFAGSKITIDAYLSQLVKQSYLDKLKANAQGGQKRARGGGALVGEDGESNFEWKWGSRAIAEIGEEGIGEFVVDFMETIEKLRRSSEDDDTAGEHGNKEIEQKRDKLLKAIGRAAGGDLQKNG